VSVPRLGRKPCCAVCSILCLAHELFICCMMSPIQIFLSTSTSTSGRRVSGVMCSGFLGFRQSDFHFHHSGISLVPQDGMMLSYTSCFIAGDQHLTIVYVRPVSPPAFLCGFALMALQKSSTDGGVLNREDRSVWTVGALGTSVMAIQIVSVR